MDLSDQLVLEPQTYKCDIGRLNPSATVLVVYQEMLHTVSHSHYAVNKLLAEQSHIMHEAEIRNQQLNNL